MKKIALYIPSMNGGGAERVMLTLANELSEKGLLVDLVLNRKVGVYIKNISPKVNIINLNVSRSINSLLPFSKYIKKEKPDAIISAMNYVNVVAVAAKILSCFKTKTIVVEHSNFSASTHSMNIAFKFIFKLLMRWTYNRADNIVAVSNGVAEDLSNQIKIDRSRINTIYNPVVTFEMLSRENYDMPHPWFKKDEPPVLIAVGRLSQEKDFKTLIYAFSNVREKLDCRLIILGEGSERSNLEDLIEELKLEDIIQLPGFVDNPHAWISHSNLFILSSFYEGFGNVLVEAMACGIPVISTNCPSGPSEILEDGKWGELVPVGNVELLSEAIIKTLMSSKKEGLKERASFFSVESSIDKYLELLV